MEVYDDGELVGGLYGVRIERFFAGEAMFHTATDASKMALVALVDWLNDTGAELLDVQWVTDHLASLGAVAIPRREYLTLHSAVARSEPRARLTADSERRRKRRSGWSATTRSESFAGRIRHSAGGGSRQKGKPHGLGSSEGGGGDPTVCRPVGTSISSVSEAG